MSQPSPAWGATRFNYTKEQFERLYGYLDANEWDISKAFDCVWSLGTFEPMEHDAAPILLRLIITTKAYKEIYGRSSERIWNAMMEVAKSYRVIEKAIDE